LPNVFVNPGLNVPLVLALTAALQQFIAVWGHWTW